MGNLDTFSNFQDRIVLKEVTDTALVFDCYSYIPLKYSCNSLGKMPSLLTVKGYRRIAQMNIGESNSWTVNLLILQF